MPRGFVVAFNHANVKRLINDPNVTRRFVREMSSSEHISQAFKDIVTAFLEAKPRHKHSGQLFTLKKWRRLKLEGCVVNEEKDKGRRRR